MLNEEDIDKIVGTLSRTQIVFLEAAWYKKIYRSSMGWGYDIGDRARCVFKPATVRSLWNRGLITGNFNDPRVLGPSSQLMGIDNLDGRRHAHWPDVPMFMVWTSPTGLAVLQYLELVPDAASVTIH